ncbi:MAG: HPr family phosphocarrier protein [Eubacteriaceae bacterium]|jgi:phosphocarrier protein HPr
MFSKQVTVINPTGLHARPVAEFCKAANEYNSNITIRRAEQEKLGNAKSVLSVMCLGLGQGTLVEVAAEGDDEKEAVERLTALIDTGFGEV